jgi:hypothetical protein
MQVTSKSVVETLIAIDAQRISASRLRGLKPSLVRFCFSEGLVKDYAGHGVLLSPKGVEVVKAARPEWQSISRRAATCAA